MRVLPHVGQDGFSGTGKPVAVIGFNTPSRSALFNGKSAGALARHVQENRGNAPRLNQLRAARYVAGRRTGETILGAFLSAL